MADLKASSQKKNLAADGNQEACSDFDQCPVTTAIDVIGGKWKVIILYQLRGQTLRFGELKRRIPKITQKMLTQQLRELEKDKLINRHVYAEVPPKVEYTPTQLANSLNPVLDQLCDWGKEYEASHQSPKN